LEEHSCSKRKFIGAMTLLASADLGDSYLIVDYDRNNFSVSQALFPDTNVPQELVTIFAPSEHGSSHAMSTAAIAGIVVGAAIGVIILLGIAFLTRRRWLPKTLKDFNEYHQPGIAKPELDSMAVDNSKRRLDPRSGLVEAGCNEIIIPELHTTETIQHEAMGGERPLVELSGSRAMVELPSCLPGPNVYHALDGRYELS
jgi:hypothetical protein